MQLIPPPIGTSQPSAYYGPSLQSQSYTSKDIYLS